MTQVGSPSLLDQLLVRLQERESLELEYKAAGGGLPGSVWPTVSAFANTQGGWILLGVDENTDPPIVGISNPDQVLQQLDDLMRNSQKISLPAMGPNDAVIERVGEKQIIVIRVPAAPRRVCPVYINGNPYSGTYLRRHAGDYHCSKAEVDRMMREALDTGADSTILPHYGLDDLDDEALRRYRQRSQTNDPASPRNGYDNQRFLQAIGAFRRDREAGVEGLTVAGVLLLGRSESITEWRNRHLIDFRVLPDDSSDRRWLDRVAWEGGLFPAFERLYPKLVEGLPSPFQLEGPFRVDEGPHREALREALVNFLVHADYAEPDASLVKRTPEGYYFRNPGNSRVLETDLLAGDRSDPRNPLLVRMFRLVGLADEAGTGMPKIVRAWRSLGFQLPEIEVGTERYEFALTLRHAHFLAEHDRTWLQSLGDNWNEAEQLALCIARHHGEVDNLSVRRLTGQHMADVTRVLGGLRDRGLLQMIGVKRGARYQLGHVAVVGLPDVRLEPPLDRSEQSSLVLPDRTVSESLPPNSDGSGLTSNGLPPNSDSSGGSGSKPQSPALDSEQLQQELLRISAPSRERRYLRAGLRDDLIVQLCALVPLSLRELAHLLGRGEPSLRDPVRSLIASGWLSYLYPDRPTHRRQKYVATATGPSSREPGSTP